MRLPLIAPADLTQQQKSLYDEMRTGIARSATDCSRRRQETGLLPSAPPSAIATTCFFLATSKGTKTSLSFPMVRPPCMRLGMPEQPSFIPARKGGPPAPAREHDV